MNPKYDMVENSIFLKKELLECSTKLLPESPLNTPQILSFFNEQSNNEFNETFLRLLVPTPTFAPKFQEKEQEDGWNLISENSDFGECSVSILYKTRKVKPTVSLPERMYSSIKYELVMNAKGELLNRVQFLMAKVFVVDSITGEILSQQTSLKGNVEVALTLSPHKSGAEGKLLVQIAPGISFHKEKREFRLLVSFFADANLLTPVLVKRSKPFRVYARKPNKPKKKKGEKKEDCVKNESGKKRKSSSLYKKKKKPDMKIEIQNKDLIRPESEFSVFEKKLEGLMEMMNKLSEEEKKKALEMVLSKFNELPDEKYLITPCNVALEELKFFSD